VSLRGHLTAEHLREQLAPISAQLLNASAPRGLLVDCTEMTGYELEARHAFVELMTRHRARLSAVAVVTSKPIWQMVVSTMAMASRTEMKAFDDVEQAHAWLSAPRT
jgi:hypothetical protein